MTKKYYMIVRDRIILGRPHTDSDLERLDGIYKSPVFLTDGTLEGLDAAIDYFRRYFNHFIDWTATVVEVE